MPRARSGADAITIGALMVAVAIAFHDVIGPARGLLFRDHLLAFKPLWWSAIEAIKDGRWPVVPLGGLSQVSMERTWNAAFYTPATLLFFAAPFDVAYDLFVAGHVAWAALGGYVLARSLGSSPWAAAVAGAAALTGPVLSFENLLVGLQCWAWAPWVMVLLRRALLAPSLLVTAGLAMALGCELMSLLPEVVLLQAIALPLLVPLRRPSPAALAGVLAATLLAAGCAVVDLAPVLETWGEARRSGGLTAEEKSGWALSALQLVELIAPSFWSPPELSAFNVPAATGHDRDPPYLLSLYLGSMIPLAVAALVTGPRRLTWALGSLVVVSLVVATGSATPLHGWLTSLPVLSSTRYAIKYTTFAGVALAALAAWSIDHQQRARTTAVIAATALAVSGLSLTSVFGSAEITDWLARSSKPLSNGGVLELFREVDMIALAQSVMTGRLMHGALASALLTAALVAGTVARARPWGAAMVAVVVLGDLSWAGQRAVLGTDLAAQALPAAVRDEVQGRWVYLALPPPVPSGVGATPFEDTVIHRGRHGWNTFYGMRRYEPIDLDGQGDLLAQRTFERVLSLPWREGSPLLARAGVSRALSAYPLADRKVVEIEDGPDVFALDAARPHVWSTSRWQVVPAESALATLERRDGTAVVSSGMLMSSTASCAEDLTVVDSRPELWRFEVESRASCPTLLVVQEPMQRGWIAEIDGVEAALVKAEVGRLGVPVPAGRHRVVLEYRSTTARVAWISMVSWGGIVALAIAGAWIRRSSAYS